MISANRLTLLSVFVICGAGGPLGTIIPDRRNPALLAWVGSLASGCLLLLLVNPIVEAAFGGYNAETRVANE